jgi:hypothetical protein
LWGADVPATDIDFLEYDRGRAVALCEWKHEFSQDVLGEIKIDANMRARIHLANSAKIPLFVIVRSDDMSWFDVIAQNSIAIDYFKSIGVPIKERIYGEDNFIRFLYYIRKREAPQHIIDYVKNNPYVKQTNFDLIKNLWNSLSKNDKDKFFQTVSQKEHT